MRRRLITAAFFLLLLALGGLGMAVYATADGVEVFGVATTTTAPPRSTPTTSSTTLAPTPSPSPTPNVTAEINAALLSGDDLLKPGSTGPAVLALETRLRDQRYDVATPDATYDEATADAVMAFQKVNDLDRDGVAGPKTRKALTEKPADTTPLAGPGAAPNRLEIDLGRQVMFLWTNNALDRIIAVSTGSGQWFVVEEEFRVSIAVTNPGEFEIGRKYPDWEKGPLGSLYKPMYFDGGIAIHGYLSVPPYPASHGCVRTPMHTQDWLYDAIPQGFPVYVFGESPAPQTDRPPTPTRPPPPPSPSATETVTAPAAAASPAPPATDPAGPTPAAAPGATTTAGG